MWKRGRPPNMFLHRYEFTGVGSVMVAHLIVDQVVRVRVRPGAPTYFDLKKNKSK